VHRKTRKRPSLAGFLYLRGIKKTPPGVNVPGGVFNRNAYAPTGFPSVRRTTTVAERASPPPARRVFHAWFGCWMLMKNVVRSGV